jgi:hypothetical protein
MAYQCISEFTKTAKFRQENLWGRTPKLRSLADPFPEGFQAIHWKRYAEEKPKIMKSNNNACADSRSNAMSIFSACFR